MLIQAKESKMVSKSPVQVLQWEQEELSREAMVVELVKLRREVHDLLILILGILAQKLLRISRACIL